VNISYEDTAKEVFAINVLERIFISVHQLKTNAKLSTTRQHKNEMKIIK